MVGLPHICEVTISEDFKTRFEAERGERAGKVARLDVIPLSNGNRGWTLAAKARRLFPGRRDFDASAIDVAPLNQVTGTVVSLMERSNVDTVLVAGAIRKGGGSWVSISRNFVVSSKPVATICLKSPLSSVTFSEDRPAHHEKQIWLTRLL
ncbi:MAG TPA: hypothetical protein VF503_14300 [Sphingobium sp.]|uniref:hypothetical protein n=1 Tax=Sphingobium sp. TaxID=1912891 RepID=UPI002ED1C6CB